VEWNVFHFPPVQLGLRRAQRSATFLYFPSVGKEYRMRVTSHATFVAFALGITVVPVISARAQEKEAAAPGAAARQVDPTAAASSIVASGAATVVAVDPAERVVVLKTADGDMIPVKCGKNVVNFDQIKAGDIVKATAIDRVAVYIGKEDPAERFGTGRVIMRAGKGERPGFLIADTAQAKAKIEAIDANAKTVTLAGAGGKSTTVSVGEDVDLSSVKKGDEITVRTTTGIALSVEKPGEAQLASEGPQTRTAIVEAVDKEQRTVTLKTAEGKTRTIHLGEEAVNFDQIAVGDHVRATMAEEVAVAIHRAGAEPRPGEASGSRQLFGAPKGAKPGVLIAATRRVTGKLDAIDAEARTIVLSSSEGGKPQKIKVGPKVELEGLKAGDEIAARVTEAMAVVVEKPSKEQQKEQP
jgi:hypothetical protein